MSIYKNYTTIFPLIRVVWFDQRFDRQISIYGASTIRTRMSHMGTRTWHLGTRTWTRKLVTRTCRLVTRQQLWWQAKSWHPPEKRLLTGTQTEPNPNAKRCWGLKPYNAKRCWGLLTLKTKKRYLQVLNYDCNLRVIEWYASHWLVCISDIYGVACT